MDEQSRSLLLSLTNDLISLNKEAESFYINVTRKEESYEPDFYNTVRPFANKVKKVREMWLPLAMQFIESEKPMYIHPGQLTQLEENLEIIAIKSFYKKTRLKMQMETYKSVHYVLTQLVQAIEQAE